MAKLAAWMYIERCIRRIRWKQFPIPQLPPLHMCGYARCHTEAYTSKCYYLENQQGITDLVDSVHNDRNYFISG